MASPVPAAPVATTPAPALTASTLTPTSAIRRHLSHSNSVVQTGDLHAHFHILILTCMAGNESASLQAINELISEDFFSTVDKAARVTLVLGNPAALRAGQPFIDKDLNSLIDSTSDFGGQCSEAERARLIARHITTCDLLIDLQSYTRQRPEQTLAIPSQPKFELQTTSGTADVDGEWDMNSCWPDKSNNTNNDDDDDDDDDDESDDVLDDEILSDQLYSTGM
jgi:succinylglutamate desuccinylase